MFTATDRLRATLLAGIVISITGILIPCPTWAQHADVWLTLENNQITISPVNIETGENTLIDSTTGYFLFLGDFGDLDGGFFETDDPGFQAQPGVLQPGAVLRYQASGSLMYWDGTGWIKTVPDQEQIHLEDALGIDTSWSISGVNNGVGTVDQVGGDGSIHQHLDFEVENDNGTGDPAVGAYRIELALFADELSQGTPVHSVSNPFFIALNRGLSEQDFDMAINALTQGTTPDLVVTPSLQGLSQIDAEAAIIQANLNLGHITLQPDNSVALGHVIAQTPMSGMSVPSGSAVDLVISLANAERPDLSIVGTGNLVDTFEIGGNMSFVLDLGSGLDRITITPAFSGQLIVLASFGVSDLINFQAGLEIVNGALQTDGSYTINLVNGGVITIAQVAQQTLQLAGVTVSFADFDTAMSNGTTISASAAMVLRDNP